jgi:hypothetical protein
MKSINLAYNEVLGANGSMVHVTNAGAVMRHTADVNSRFALQVARFATAEHSGKALPFLLQLTASEFAELTLAQAQPFKARFAAIGGQPGRRWLGQHFALQAAWSQAA